MEKNMSEIGATAPIMALKIYVILINFLLRK